MKNNICILVLIVLFNLFSNAFAYTVQEKLRTEILTLHNALRLKHHAPPLVWNSQLAQFAQEHARTCQFRHSKTPYGENLAAGYPSISAAIYSWYDEHTNYSFPHPHYSHTTGHFTQLIWKSTKKIGCAYVACNGKHNTPGNYLVCEYNPPGNILNPGYFAKNVLP